MSPWLLQYLRRMSGWQGGNWQGGGWMPPPPIQNDFINSQSVKPPPVFMPPVRVPTMLQQAAGIYGGGNSINPGVATDGPHPGQFMSSGLPDAGGGPPQYPMDLGLYPPGFLNGASGNSGTINNPGQTPIFPQSNYTNPNPTITPAMQRFANPPQAWKQPSFLQGI